MNFLSNEDNSARYYRQVVPVSDDTPVTSTTKPVVTWDPNTVENPVARYTKAGVLQRRDESTRQWYDANPVVKAASKLADIYHPVTDIANDIKKLVYGTSKVGQVATPAQLQGRVALTGTSPNVVAKLDKVQVPTTLSVVDTWAPSRKSRNKRTHATNGNPKSKAAKKRASKAAASKSATTKGIPGVPSMMSNIKSLPVITTIPVTSSYIKQSVSKPQPVADVGLGQGAIRVEFSDMLTTTVKAGSTTTTAGFGGTGTYNIILTPAGISTRLATFESMYCKYVFRALQFTYIPQINSSTSVGVSLGMIPDQTVATRFSTVPSAQTVLQMNPSIATSCWQPAEFRYENNGTRLYSTAGVGAHTQTYEDWIQGQVFCVLDGSPSASTTYGKVRVVGYIDFYQSRPFENGSPSVQMYSILSSLTPVERYLKLREWWETVQRYIPFISSEVLPHPSAHYRGSSDPAERNMCLPPLSVGTVYNLLDYQPSVKDMKYDPITVPKPTSKGKAEDPLLAEEKCDEEWMSCSSTTR